MMNLNGFSKTEQQQIRMVISARLLQLNMSCEKIIDTKTFRQYLNEIVLKSRKKITVSELAAIIVNITVSDIFGYMQSSLFVKQAKEVSLSDFNDLLGGE